MNDSYPILYCAYHPDVETGLRCNNCEKPICPKCAILTPTGYRCKECVRSHQRIFETAQWYDYPIAIVIAGVLSFLGSLIVGFIGFFTLFVAPIIGVAVAEAVRFAIRRRRSLRLYQSVTVATILASMIPLLPLLIQLLLGGGFVGNLLSLLWQSLYTITISTTVYYRLKGINIK
jgi:hypothetical protein